MPLKFHEAAKFWCATDHAYEMTGWFISEKLWTKLTAEEKKIFLDAAKEAGQLATDLVEQLDKDSIEILKKSGCTYTVPDREAFKKAWANVYKPFEGKAWPQGMVQKIQDMQK
jgi:TRAP-type C4-dicarboxylate transport system substrate-binding protein